MAEAYRVKGDVSFPRVIAKVERQGQDPFYETEGVNYPAGAVVLEENLTPRDRERAESGQLDDLLEPISLEEAQGQVHHGNEPEFGVFVAEHEAEAHALLAYGHHVVPDDQVLEAQASGAQHATDYQEAVKNAGLDRRPMQEMMAQSRARVPDEALVGGQTRTGLPYNRGPEQGPSDESEEGQREEESKSEQENKGEPASPATRPRPGSEPSSEGQGT